MSETTANLHERIEAFGTHYDYDASYLVNLHDASPGAFDAFAGGQGMSTHRAELPLDAHFVARVTAMRADDCGPCSQLNLRMAVEAGVPRDVLEALLERPDELPEPLRDVHDHVRAVTANDVVDRSCAERIRARYGEAAFAELAVVVAGCRIYPTVKRALLASESCARLTLDF